MLFRNLFHTWNKFFVIYANQQLKYPQIPEEKLVKREKDKKGKGKVMINSSNKICLCLNTIDSSNLFLRKGRIL